MTYKHGSIALRRSSWAPSGAQAPMSGAWQLWYGHQSNSRQLSQDINLVHMYRSLNSSRATTFSTRNPAPSTVKTTIILHKSSSCWARSPVRSASQVNGPRKSSAAKGNFEISTVSVTGRFRTCCARSIISVLRSRSALRNFSRPCWSLSPVDGLTREE